MAHLDFCSFFADIQRLAENGGVIHFYREWLNARPYFRILSSLGKMMTCYLRDTNKFFKYCTLCTNIPYYRFPSKGIKLPRFVIFEVLGLSLEVLRRRPFE